MPSLARSDSSIESAPSPAIRAELRRLGDELDRLRAEYQARWNEFEQLRVNPCAHCEQPIPPWLFSKRSRALKKARKALADATRAERDYRQANFARQSHVKGRAVIATRPETKRFGVTAKPHGWQDPRHLLGDLMRAFGWDPDKEQAGRATKRMLGAISSDPEVRDTAYRREFEEAAPLLRALIARAEKLRSWPLRKPAEYEREWRSIVETWNQAIRDQGWLELPPFCEVCGRPVQRRATWRSPEDPDKPQLSFVCSEPCRNIYRQRGNRMRSKLAAANSDE